jgi:translation initiation factor eIF-2B subunit delta
MSQLFRLNQNPTMPAPTKPIPPTVQGESSGSQPQKSQKPTKAERRELQRVAKQGGTQVSGSSSALKAPSTPVSASWTRNASNVVGDDREGKSRGLRIFSHFGLPKPVSIAVKGDIHPTIVRLGLQFSEFKISGANARCIATLTAFKIVRPTCELS